LVSSDVPQGSLLSTFLIILFIINLPSIFDSSVGTYIILFFDNTKIFSIIKSPNDTSQKQSNLDKFVEWSRVNRLYIIKCNVIYFLRLNNIITYNYKIENFTLTRVNSVRNFGLSL